MKWKSQRREEEEEAKIPAANCRAGIERKDNNNKKKDRSKKKNNFFEKVKGGGDPVDKGESANGPFSCSISLTSQR